MWGPFPSSARADVGLGMKCASTAFASGVRSFDAGTGSCVDGNGECNEQTALADLRSLATPRLALLGSLSVRELANNSFASAPCRQARIADPPSWITSAFWAQENNIIGVLNGHKGQISFYDLQGRLRRRIDYAIPLEGVGEYRGRRLAKGRGNSFFVLGKDFKLSAQIKPSGFGSLYSGWVVNGNELVAYGSVNRERGTFQLGFVRVDLDKSTTELLPMPEPTPNNFYLINNPYFATTRGEAYFLAMNNKPTIYRLPQNAKPAPLATMPKEYVKCPRLEQFGAATVRERFHQLEYFRMPVGLYGDAGFIYLLVKDPEACSPWRIFKIDPENDRLVGSVPLPSLARRIALIPGSRQWVIIEKGMVVSAGQEIVKSVQAVPSAWITEPATSPLRHRPELNNCIADS